MAEDLEMEFIEMARAVDELVDSPPPPAHHLEDLDLVEGMPRPVYDRILQKAQRSKARIQRMTDILDLMKFYNQWDLDFEPRYPTIDDYLDVADGGTLEARLVAQHTLETALRDFLGRVLQFGGGVRSLPTAFSRKTVSRIYDEDLNEFYADVQNDHHAEQPHEA